MSCNITAGIAKGCNDQIGGIAGVHYIDRDPNAAPPLLDSNGVVIDYDNTRLWYWVDAENQQGNVTETYEFGSGTSVLGFNQKATFFIPDTAKPSTTGGTSYTVNNFAGMIAQQNNMAMMIETKHAAVTRGPWPKCYLFGHERGAYCSGGNKQSGINYTDNNGYTIEISANSKEPMLEISYMTVHLPQVIDTNQYALLSSRWSSDPAVGLQSWTPWDYTPLKEYIGGNVRFLIPPVPGPDIWVQEGDNCSFKTAITADWNANAFDANGDFRVKAFTTFSAGNTATNQATITQAPTAPGVQTIVAEYTNIGPGFPYGGQGGDIYWTPLILAIDDPAVYDQTVIFTDGAAQQGDVEQSIQIMAVTQS